MKKEDILKEFIIPGQVGDEHTVSIDEHGYVTGNVPGTMALDFKPFRLGMPKGFNKSRCGNDMDNKCIHIFIYDNLEDLCSKLPNGYNNLNIPVWHLEKEGCVFVKVISPRVNYIWIQIIGNCTKEEWLEKFPNTKGSFDIGEIYEDID